MRNSSSIFLIIFFIIFLILANGIIGESTVQCQDEDIKLNKIEQKESGTRKSSNEDNGFIFTDNIDDVWLIDYKKDEYNDSYWFDIKSITSKFVGSRIWLNMTLFDNVQDDEEIYYKMRAADAEIILYHGRGEILYSKGSENKVTFKNNIISAEVDPSRISYNTFQISGSVYQEGSNSEIGEYLILDEVGKSEKNENNSKNLTYTDDRFDVKKLYTVSKSVDDKPEVDILNTQYVISEMLTVKVTYGSAINSDEGYEYVIHFGDTIFKYSSGQAILEYNTELEKSFDYSIENNSMTVVFDISKIIFLPFFEIESEFIPSQSTSYKDDQHIELPKFLYIIGEKLHLTITMFEKNSVIMRLGGTLSIDSYEKVREVIDDMGNYNGEVEDFEYEKFIVELNTYYSVEDFFEFYPLVETKTGKSTMEFDFQNMLKNTSKSNDPAFSIICRWEFSEISSKQNNLSFYLISKQQESLIGLNFIFDFEYKDILFNLSSEFKNWEFDSDTIYPELLKLNFDRSSNEIKMNIEDFELMKHQIRPQEEFGFSIKYNESSVDIDNGESKKDEEKSTGFLNSFEISILLLSSVIIIFYITSLRKKHNK